MAAMTGKGFRPKRKAAVKASSQAGTRTAAAAPPLPDAAAKGACAPLHPAELERLSSKPATGPQAFGRASFRPSALAEGVEGGARADSKSNGMSGWQGSAKPTSQAEGAGEQQQAAQPDAHAAAIPGGQQALRPQHQAEGQQGVVKPSFPSEVTGGQHALHPHHQQALSTGGWQGTAQAASPSGATAGQRGHFSQARTRPHGIARFQQVPHLDC